MKKILFSLLVVAAVALLASPALHAQGLSAIVKVPFSFIAAGRVLPAGTYRVTPDVNDPSLLTVETDRGDRAVFVQTVNVADTAQGTEDATLAFKSFGGQHFLWRIGIAGHDTREVVLQPAAMQQVLAKLNLSPAEPALGASAK